MIPAASAHVLDDNARISWDMPAEVLCENSAFNVGWTTGSEVNYERQSFTLVKGRLFRGAYRSRDRCEKEESKK